MEKSKSRRGRVGGIGPADAHVGYGSGIAWTDDLDISGSYPQTLAEE